jgi:hypothetical protein
MHIHGFFRYVHGNRSGNPIQKLRVVSSRRNHCLIDSSLTLRVTRVIRYKFIPSWAARSRDGDRLLMNTGSEGREDRVILSWETTQGR